MHILVTRFNVRYPTKAMPTAPLVDAKYTRKRWKIFTEFTLPSIQRQTIRPDMWALYFDEERTKPIRAELDEVAQAHPYISVRFVEHAEEVLPDFRLLAAASADKTVVTSRVDNDDILHPKFIEDVMSAACLQEASKCVIDFPNFYALRMNDFIVRPESMLITTPFSSLSETGGDISTVLSVEHRHLGPTIGLVRQLPQYRTMAIWHESNVHNGKFLRRPKNIINRWLGRERDPALSAENAALVLSDYGLS